MIKTTTTFQINLTIPSNLPQKNSLHPSKIFSPISMRNWGMDGVGMAKTLCFPDHPDENTYRIMVKGTLQIDAENKLAEQWKSRREKFYPGNFAAESQKPGSLLANLFDH